MYQGTNAIQMYVAELKLNKANYCDTEIFLDMELSIRNDICHMTSRLGVKYVMQ